MRLPRINFLLLLILGITLLLRLPSLWEPYWYGDEGIYLALGQAMQRGAVLYRDIWDNKPPLLYLLYALYPTLLFAKALATIFVLGSITGIYFLAKKFFLESKLSAICSVLSALLVGIFLSIPLLEGTIANAELFFILPIVWGAYFLLCHAELDSASIETAKWFRFRVKPGMTIVVGLLMASAFLLKVPAVFDFFGMFLAISINRLIKMQKISFENIKRFVSDQFKFYFPIISIFILLLAAVVLYFYLNSGLSDFLTAAFSQNASYVAVGSGALSKLSNPLFAKGIILLLGSFVLFVLFVKRKISKELLFLSLWFGFSLYGALLSNRPYLHYLLQIVPPTSILLIYLAFNIKKYFVYFAFLFLIFYFLFRQFTGAFALHTETYYQNWFDYASERKSWEDYVNFFDSRTLNSYAVASYIKHNTNPTDPIFVWGDAAFVYVLSNRPPATKFIQAHHLTTIDPKNYDRVINRLIEVKPKFILISRPGHFAFPKLEELVAKNYHEVAVFSDLYVYRLN